MTFCFCVNYRFFVGNDLCVIPLGKLYNFVLRNGTQAVPYIVDFIFFIVTANGVSRVAIRFLFWGVRIAAPIKSARNDILFWHKKTAANFAAVAVLII